ncbi:MAG: UDP-3-O-acyl-N-acetylglucosamine deacetylase [Pseudomonadota bacterium]
MFDEPANDMTAAATLAETARLSGIGLHSGVVAELVIEPAEAGHGICFVRSDLAQPEPQRTIKADPALVTKTQLGTVLTNHASVSISTVEHLMAAFAMLGITDAKVLVSGPEVPILDGSSAPFIEALQQSGVRVMAKTVDAVAPKGRVMVARGASWAVAEPLPEDSMVDVILDVTIAFDHPSIGTQRVLIEGDRETILREVAEARTFCLLQEVEAMKAMGLCQGGSLDNAIVVGNDGIINDGGLRMDKEFVRHKALDLVGDLYLLGAPLGCKITAYKPGHTLNTALATALSDHGVEQTVFDAERVAASA